MCAERVAERVATATPAHVHCSVPLRLAANFLAANDPASLSNPKLGNMAAAAGDRCWLRFSAPRTAKYFLVRSSTLSVAIARWQAEGQAGWSSAARAMRPTTLAMRGWRGWAPTLRSRRRRWGGGPATRQNFAARRVGAPAAISNGMRMLIACNFALQMKRGGARHEKGFRRCPARVWYKLSLPHAAKANWSHLCCWHYRAARD